MINHSVIYNRDFKNDFPHQCPNNAPGLGDKCQRVALAVLPLCSLHQPFQGPLSLGLSGLRSVTYFSQMMGHFQKGEVTEGAYHLFHASLATLSVGLFFFNPVFCFLSSSASDLIINSRHFIQHAREGNYQKMCESLSFMTLDLLFIASFTYGAIEITVACMAVQILLDFYLSAKHFKNGEYLEGMTNAIMGSAHLQRAFPQMKLLQWKRSHDLDFTAELKQNDRGFVYLDIPDEHLYSLYEVYKEKGMELPPYFGKKMAGAHVSVIMSDEMRERPGIKIEDIGKKFQFRIVQMGSVKPEGWAEMEQVYFLTLACPELESVRTNHGFTPRISDRDFHFTFGLKRA